MWILCVFLFAVIRYQPWLLHVIIIQLELLICKFKCPQTGKETSLKQEEIISRLFSIIRTVRNHWPWRTVWEVLLYAVWIFRTCPVIVSSRPVSIANWIQSVKSFDSIRRATRSRRIHTERELAKAHLDWRIFISSPSSKWAAKRANDLELYRGNFARVEWLVKGFLLPMES